MPVTSSIHARCDEIRVNPCGAPFSQLNDPKLVRPIKALLSAEMSGPPESPRQALRFSSPFTQITFLRNNKNGNLVKHFSIETVFKLVYCNVGAIVLSESCIKPFPMATASWFLLEEQAICTGLIRSLNSMGCGSLIKAMSLLNDFEKREKD